METEWGIGRLAIKAVVLLLALGICLLITSVFRKEKFDVVLPKVQNGLVLAFVLLIVGITLYYS